jgi:choline dehydrogenase-like flavoprotein
VTRHGQRALQAVCETLLPDPDAGLAAAVLARARRLPTARDRRAFAALITVLESRPFNLLVSGSPRRFSDRPRAERERVLLKLATSRFAPWRRAFQALKRLVTTTHYTVMAQPGSPSWREIGYPGPSATPAPPPAADDIRPFPVAHDTRIDCDVVIVGSGAGGSVVAAELAARGVDVILIERGGHYRETDFTQRESDMLERLYDAGALRTTSDLGLLLLQGSCLGGGTVINYTTSFHTPSAVRSQWAREHGLPHFTSTAFTNSLDTVASRLSVSTEESTPGGRDCVMARGLERLRWHRGVIPRNVRGCSQAEDCGYCVYGCRRGAKQSTLVTYLRDAARRGARIIVRAEAERVLFERGRAVGVRARVQGPKPIELTVRAKSVVVAAGAIHSPALLLRSGVRLPALGRHLALHPATAVFGVMDHEVRPWTGSLQTRYSDQFADLDGKGFGFRFETAPIHPSLAALAAPWESAAGHREVMKCLPRLALAGILLRDRFGGRVTVDRNGQPLVRYRLSEYDIRHLRRGLSAAAELLEAAGAKEIWAPTVRWLPYRPGGLERREQWLKRLDAAGYGPNQLLLVSFHQMASCRMGAEGAGSVVNSDHQVWGVPGLYVVDASAFPSSSGVNPMLTIMGIAHRAAQLIG